MRDHLCSECDERATRTGAYGEPFCERHWRDAGMYDPDQGYVPTARDWIEFSNHDV